MTQPTYYYLSFKIDGKWIDDCIRFRTEKKAFDEKHRTYANRMSRYQDPIPTKIFKRSAIEIDDEEREWMS